MEASYKEALKYHFRKRKLSLVPCRNKRRCEVRLSLLLCLLHPSQNSDFKEFFWSGNLEGKITVCVLSCNYSDGL